MLNKKGLKMKLKQGWQVVRYDGCKIIGKNLRTKAAAHRALRKLKQRYDYDGAFLVPINVNRVAKLRE